MRVVVLTCTSWEALTGLYMSFASRDSEREIACGTLEMNERVAGSSPLGSASSLKAQH